MRVPRVFRRTGWLILTMVVVMLGASATFIVLGSRVTKVVTDYEQTPTPHPAAHLADAYKINFSGLRNQSLPADRIQPYLSAVPQPRGLAFDGEELFMAAAGDNSLKKAAADGSVSLVTDELGEATSLVIDDRYVIVPIPAENRVVRVDKQSGKVSTLVSGLAQPTGIIRSRNGGYYVTTPGDGSLVKITTDGRVQVVATDLKQPIGVVVDNDNIIRVAQAGDPENSVVQIADNGKRTTVVHGLIGARALYYDTLKNLLISHTASGHSALSIFFANGDLAPVLTTPLSEPIISLTSDNKFVYFTAQKGDESGVYRVPLPQAK